jgi:hypothetical protein
MTLTEEQAILIALKAAYIAVIGGSEYTITIGGTTRRYKRNDILVLRKEIEDCEERIAGLQSETRGIQIKFGTPHR